MYTSHDIFSCSIYQCEYFESRRDAFRILSIRLSSNEGDVIRLFRAIKGHCAGLSHVGLSDDFCVTTEVTNALLELLKETTVDLSIKLDIHTFKVSEQFSCFIASNVSELVISSRCLALVDRCRVFSRLNSLTLISVGESDIPRVDKLLEHASDQLQLTFKPPLDSKVLCLQLKKLRRIRIHLLEPSSVFGDGIKHLAMTNRASISFMT